VIDIKTQHVSQKSLFLATGFVFLHGPNDKLIFRGTFFAHVPLPCEDVSVIFFNFLNI
jgi:hypothetical protein